MLLDPQAQGGIEGPLGRLVIRHVVGDEGTEKLDGRLGHEFRCVRFVEHVADAERGEVGPTSCASELLSVPIRTPRIWLRTRSGSAISAPGIWKWCSSVRVRAADDGRRCPHCRSEGLCSSCTSLCTTSPPALQPALPHSRHSTLEGNRTHEHRHERPDSLGAARDRPRQQLGKQPLSPSTVCGCWTPAGTGGPASSRRPDMSPSPMDGRTNRSTSRQPELTPTCLPATASEMSPPISR